MHASGGGFGAAVEPGGLQLGLALADGTRLLPMSYREPGREATPPTLFVNSMGGGGGEDWYEGRAAAWVWSPSRPLGDADLVLAWESFGIGELRHPLRASSIAAAPAPRPLWPSAAA
jgi:hypothetical protein